MSFGTEVVLLISLLLSLSRSGKPRRPRPHLHRCLALYRLYTGSISASPTACPLRGMGVPVLRMTTSDRACRWAWVGQAVCMHSVCIGTHARTCTHARTAEVHAHIRRRWPAEAESSAIASAKCFSIYGCVVLICARYLYARGICGRAMFIRARFSQAAVSTGARWFIGTHARTHACTHAPQRCIPQITTLAAEPESSAIASASRAPNDGCSTSAEM